MKGMRGIGLAVVVTLTALATGAAPLHAQRYFGENQVEYRHFRWQIIETEHFRIYYYPEEATAARDAARMAERSYTRLSMLFGHQFREKKPIMLFASRQDFGQNNVTGDLGEGTGGVTDASRQRIMVPFTGDYDSFQHVLAHEMTHQFQYDIFSRGRAGEDLQILEQVNPPLWFMEGMAEYLSLGPNHILTTTWVRDAVVNGNLPTIRQMTDQPDKYFPYRYGEALFRYIGQRWGDAAIGQIMQSVARVGIDRAFQRELGLTLDQLSDQWREAVRAQYLPELASLQRVRDFAQPMLNPRRTQGSLFLAPVLSPDGKTIAFLSRGSEKRGEVFIDLWLGDALTGKRIKRLVESTLNPHFEELRLLYSQGSFSNDGRYFAFTAQTSGRDVLSIVNIKTDAVKQLTNIPLDGVVSPSWSPDGKHLVFSGTNGGITDIYIVDADGTNLRAMTKDRYGDLQPSWSPDGKYIAFATDRESTKLANLELGKMQIAVMNVDDGTIRVLPDQHGLNINPVWSPDGQSLAYISDRTGAPNIFMYDLATQQNLQVTNVQGGVSAITEYSPALTWSRGTDRMAFTYYDNNDYTIWSLDHPQAFARTQTQPAQVANNTPTTNAPSPTATAQDSTKDSTAQKQQAGERSSTYRAPTGSRRSAVVTSRETQTDSTGTVSVAALMANPNLGLPDTLTFKYYPYSVHFSPDYISGADIGVAGGDGYGTVFGGQTALVFSDITGDHQLAVGAGVYGRLSDASLLVGYTDLSHRLQYSTSASRQVFYINTGATVIEEPDFIRYQYQFERFALNNATFTSEYPLNRFSRFELGLQFNSIGRSIVNQNYDDNGLILNVNYETVESFAALNYLSPVASFVSDNTLTGLTGPVSGRRMRFSVAPSVGNVHWIQYMGDYRRYDPVIFNTLTFATRFFTQVTNGRDADLLPTYIGQPEFVRGYDRENFYGGYTCTSFLGASDVNDNTCASAALVGTRVAVANEELRFPIIRRFDLGSLPLGLPPTDGLIFYDAGLAWSSGQKVSLTKPDDYDLDLQRYVMRSWGFGIRVNLFDLAVLRWDYAKPLDRVPNKWNWTFSLGPSF